MGDTKSTLIGCLVLITGFLICFGACGYIDGCMKSFSAPDATVTFIPNEYQGNYKQVSNAIENGDEEPYFLQISANEITIANPLDDYSRTEIIKEIDLYENWIKMHFRSKTLDKDMEFLLILHEGVYDLYEEINGETMAEYGHFVRMK